MAATKINGAGVAITAAGAVIAWAGIRNVPILEAFRDLAMGKAPTPHDKAPFEPVAFTVGAAAADTGLDLAASSMAGGKIIAGMAAQKGRPYRFGGGHGGNPCSGAGDCSGAVSCALVKAGVLKGSLTTDGLSRWGKPVSFAAREPGDVLVWVGGPGGGHCGVVLDTGRMWHTPCTGCGGVQVGTYRSSRSGRPTIVRRAGR